MKFIEHDHSTSTHESVKKNSEKSVLLKPDFNHSKTKVAK